MAFINLLNIFKFVASCSLFLIAMSSIATAQQQPPQRSTERFGDWSALCTVNEPLSCHIKHQILLGNSSKPALEINIGRPNTNPSNVIMIVTLPLGIRLPEGFRIQVGDKIDRQYPFIRCIHSGCQSELSFDEELLDSFKKGNEGRIIISDAINKKVAIPFSLKGFTKAFGRVTNP
ncbi:invasion associated locus B family protein [Kiloniella sp. EL199]|uniref:invasion associated locus B family protein n=1 Tax=Kiloniella sp. EL199 TaxID=2107581 RepID=UPI000EA0CBAB|nr:invasion associated locus B family protein [Kiloniella sp. EL199]